MRDSRQLVEGEIHVTLPDGTTGTVTTTDTEIILNNGSYKEGHTLQSLVHNARCGQLPAWVAQVSGLRERIDNVIKAEQKQGLDPFTKYATGDGKIVHIDLRTGIRLSANIDELQRRFKDTGRLPRAFESVRAKELLGVES